MSRRKTLERCRVVGAEVTVGDYYEMHRGGTLWRVDRVRVVGRDVTITFAQIGGEAGNWTSLFSVSERVHVWRAPEVPR